MSYEVVNLFDICDPKQWKTISTQELKSEGYFVYGANGIIGYYDKYTHENPTLAITCRGATCGEIHITKEFSYINGNAMALDNLNKDIDIKFLYFYFKMRKFNDVISGSAQPQITRQGLKNIHIPLPPLDIQKKIADTLDKAQGLIDKRKEQISALDKFLENLFLDMFGDPVSNPMGWEREPIENVTSLVSSGSTPKGGSNVYSTEGIYFIRSQNVLMNKLKLEDISFINNDIHNGMKRTWLKNNDVLLNITGASIGRVAYYNLGNDLGNVNQHVCILRPNDLINHIFLTHQISNNHFQNYIFGMQSGGTREAFNFTQIKQFNVILPPLDLQNQFASIVEKVEAEKTKLEVSLTEMEDNFNSIMQRAFKGELF